MSHPILTRLNGTLNGILVVCAVVFALFGMVGSQVTVASQNYTSTLRVASIYCLIAVVSAGIALVRPASKATRLLLLAVIVVVAITMSDIVRRARWDGLVDGGAPARQRYD